ncbi:MAG: hypothetical protein IKS49_06770 [Actinomycetaceae bacterium]|nr:hypothetical protein [Actinomycetaceae bacterium]
MRTKAGFGIAVLGVIVFVSGIVSLISGLTHPQIEASAVSGESAYVMTEPGVLDLVNDKVQVTVQAASEDSTVSLGIGTAEDVQAWSQGLPVFDVTGLKDWQHFSGTDRPAEVEDRPDATGSDLWLHEESGQGSVSFDYKVIEPGNTSLIAHSSDNEPVTLTLSWKRPHVVIDTLPIAVIGGLMVAIGVVLSLIGLQEGEESVRQWFNSWRQRRRKKKLNSAPLDLSGLDISVPSRDELVSQDRDQQRHNTGGVLGAGIIPLINEDFREDTIEVPRRRRSRAAKDNGKGSDDEA